MLDSVKRAYWDFETNKIASFLIYPLRECEYHFSSKFHYLECEENKWKYTIGKICIIVAQIFAYMILGFPALIGTCINLYFQRPISELVTQDEALDATTKFLKEVNQAFLGIIFAIRSIRIESGSLEYTNNCPYTYKQDKKLTFDIQNIKDPTEPNEELQEEGKEFNLSEEDKAEFKTTFPNTNLNAYLNRAGKHFLHIKKMIVQITLKHNWIPKKWLVTDGINNRFTLTIPLPDHIPMPTHLTQNA